MLKDDMCDVLYCQWAIVGTTTQRGGVINIRREPRCCVVDLDNANHEYCRWAGPGVAGAGGNWCCDHAAGPSAGTLFPASAEPQYITWEQDGAGLNNVRLQVCISMAAASRIVV